MPKLESIRILGKVEDVFDSNVDVSITLEDGYTYILVVATYKNILTLMENEKSDFLSPGEPMIIVRKLTEEIIKKAIEAYAEDEAYYLKFYGAALDVKTLDVLKDRSIARSKFIDDLLEKGQSIDNIENYNLIGFNMNIDEVK